MQNFAAFTSFIVLLPTVVVGVILWFSARTRRGILFGVSVPLDFPGSPAGRSILRRYHAAILFLTVGACISTLPSVMRALPWCAVMAVPLLLTGGITLWLFAHRSVRPVAVQAPVERYATLPLATISVVPTLLTAAALIPSAASAAYLAAHRGSLPARIPVHYDSAGHVNGWISSSDGSVFLLPALGAGAVILMFGVTLFLRVVPIADRRSALRIMLPRVAALAWVLSLLFSALAFLPFFPSLSPDAMMAITLASVLAVGAVVLDLVRRIMKEQGSAPYDGTSNSGWRAGGLVYYDPADAAVLVPQRFGWGWTLNFARPAAWLYTGAVFVFVIVFAALPFLLRHS